MRQARSKVFLGSETLSVTETPAKVKELLTAAQTKWIDLHDRSNELVAINKDSIDGVTPVPGPIDSVLSPIRGLLSVARDLTVIAALAVTVLTFFPDLTPSTSQTAIIKDVHIDQGVTFEEYQRRHLIASLLAQERIGPVAHSPSVDTRGAVVLFGLSTNGFRSRHLVYRWTLFSKAGNRVVAESEEKDPLPITFTPAKREKDFGTWESWIDSHGCQQRCFVRLEIYDNNGDRVTYKNTPTFRSVAASPPPMRPSIR